MPTCITMVRAWYITILIAYCRRRTVYTETIYAYALFDVCFLGNGSYMPFVFKCTSRLTRFIGKTLRVHIKQVLLFLNLTSPR